MNRRLFLFTTAVSTIAAFHASPGRANPASAIRLLAETGCTLYTIYNTLNDNTSGETLLSAIENFRKYIKDAEDIENSIAQFDQPKEKFEKFFTVEKVKSAVKYIKKLYGIVDCIREAWRIPRLAQNLSRDEWRRLISALLKVDVVRDEQEKIVKDSSGRYVLEGMEDPLIQKALDILFKPEPI